MLGNDQGLKDRFRVQSSGDAPGRGPVNQNQLNIKVYQWHEVTLEVWAAIGLHGEAMSSGIK